MEPVAPRMVIAWTGIAASTVSAQQFEDQQDHRHGGNQGIDAV